ncbi:MAG TPA: PAS domain-containing protein [Verrucomicrobiae bacterium]
MNNSPAEKNRRILIIDDNRAIHDDFRKILSPVTAAAAALDVAESELFGEQENAVKKGNYEIDSAYQGQDGVVMVKRALDEGRPYAMAFVDIRMPPGMDGVETTQKIWAVDPEVQIVLCTAYSDYSWDEMFEKIGDSDGLLILKKPFDTVEALQLAQALTEKWWLQRQSNEKMEELEGMVAERTGELQWKTAFLEAQSNSTIDGVLVVNEQGKKIFQNQRTVELFKIPQAVADGSDDAAQVRCVADKIKNPEQFVEQVRHLYSHPDEISRDEVELKDGTILDRYSAPVIGRDGKYYGRIWTFRDVTERKRTEEALQQERNLLRTLIDSIPDYIYVRDLSNRFILANESFARLMGVPRPSALIGKRDADFYPTSTAADFDKIDQDVFAGRPFFNRERVMLFPNGQELATLNTKVPFKNDKGEVIGLIGVGRDITERKQAETALWESEAMLKESQIIANLGSYVFNAASGKWSSSEVLNLMFGIGTAYDRSVAGWVDLIHPDDRAMMTDHLRQEVLEQHQPFNKEYRIIRHDDRAERWVHGLGKLEFDDQGRPVKLIGTVQDITERKRMEAQLFQSQKMETVGKLAGGVAHEFNSILTAIIGQAELLLGDLPAGSPLAQNATAISHAADRAAALTRQLLAYGRKQFLRPEAINLNQIITGMTGVLSHLMGGENVEINIMPATGIKTVKADAGQIEQVIMNLAMNARDAMPGGGKLTLETANVTFEPDDVGRYPELKPGGYVMLAISDTGRGMSGSVKAHVFEPFFTTKDVGQGTGLGLSTCYGIIKQSGGHISVYSEPGRGTTFKIYLPQMEPLPLATAAPLDAPGLPHGTETILLVEDDQSLREMAATLLRRLGYTVLAAANGVEALSVKQQRNCGHIDLLFTDVVMPHMSGNELAGRVRALFPQTKILFTSAYTENAVIHQGVLNKGVALLQKPFTPSALAHKLREVLDRQNP